MISSCCTLRLKRRSALSIDSPSWTFTSAKLEYTPFGGRLREHLTTSIRTADRAAVPLRGPWSPTECVRLSQVNADSRRKARLPSMRSSSVRVPELLHVGFSGMKVLVVGGGGREHALAWKLSRERGVSRSALRARQRRHRRRRPARSRSTADDVDGARRRSPNASASTSPSSDPSCRSIAASPICFAARGLRVFGPSRAAAQLECSKVFAKDFMARHGIPTARYRVCDDADEARRDRRLGRARLSGRRQGRRPRGRQGRRRRGRRRRSATTRSAPRWTTGSSATPARASCSKSA